MTILVIFLLGIGNIATQRAVVKSGHPQVRRLEQALGRQVSRVSFIAEFVILLAAMLLAANGYPGAAGVYAIYSVLNGITAWLLLSRRI